MRLHGCGAEAVEVRRVNDRSLSFAQLLNDNGYHTYIAGKWHLGNTEAQSPSCDHGRGT